MLRIGLLALAVLTGLSPAWAGEPQRSFTLEELNADLAREALAAQRAAESAERLVRGCRSRGKDSIRCAGLLTGMLAMQVLIVGWHPDAKMFCVPAEVGTEQLRLVFLKWARTYPEYLHQPAALAVVAAWREAFPCE